MSDSVLRKSTASEVGASRPRTGTSEVPVAKKIIGAALSGNIPRPDLWIGANPDDLGRLLTDLLHLNTADPTEVAEFKVAHCRRDIDTNTLNAAIKLILVSCKAVKYSQPLHTKPLMRAYSGRASRITSLFLCSLSLAAVGAEI
jgi:hypothetical protein